MVDKLEEDPLPPSLRTHLHSKLYFNRKSSLHIVKDLSFILTKKIEKKHVFCLVIVSSTVPKYISYLLNHVKSKQIMCDLRMIPTFSESFSTTACR